jgi:hypothetical protein
MQRTITRKQAEKIAEKLEKVHNLISLIPCPADFVCSPDEKCISCQAYLEIAEAINLFKTRCY